jgi:hypothetical protein
LLPYTFYLEAEATWLLFDFSFGDIDPVYALGTGKLPRYGLSLPASALPFGCNSWFGFSCTLFSIIVGITGGDGDLVTFEIYYKLPSVLFMLISCGFLITLALCRPNAFPI